MDVGAIRTALANAAASATPPDGTTKLAAYDFSPGAPAVPAVFPTETVGNYKEAVGAAGAVVTLRILTSRSEEDFGQQVLNAYLNDSGASSLVVAIETAVPEASVLSFSGYRAYEHANGTFWGAELDVSVLA
jgi:hypothetical protein